VKLGVARDWKAHPAVAQVAAPPKDLFIMGDVHGDLSRLTGMLRKSGLVDADSNWTGGKAVLVCTGDIIDKWPKAVPCLQLLRSLQEQAAAAGGKVVVTMGNHEQEFLANPTDKKSEAFQGELAKLGIRPQDVAAGTDKLGLGQWMRNLPVAAKVSDWFFVHAGNTGGKTVAEIEASVRKAVDKDGFAAPLLAGPNSMLNSELTDGKWWGGAKASPEDLMKKLGVKHLVEGHQPGKVTLPDGTVRKQDEVFHFGGGKSGEFWMVDAGMSRGGDGEGAIVHIENKKSGKVTDKVIGDGHLDEFGVKKPKGKDHGKKGGGKHGWQP
jgi:hypothetical protein